MSGLAITSKANKYFFIYLPNLQAPVLLGILTFKVLHLNISFGFLSVPF